MRKLQIILDSDEVIVQNIQPLLDLYNKEYGTSLTKEEITDWDLIQFQKEGTDILKYFNQKGFFRNLPLMKESQTYIKRLMDDGHDVVIATASTKNGIIDKIEFFEEHFPFIPYTQIIPISRKELLHGDIMLDDAPHNLEVSNCTHPVIFNSLWNQNTDKYPFLKKLTRVHTWEEFYMLVCEIANADSDQRAS